MVQFLFLIGAILSCVYYAVFYCRNKETLALKKIILYACVICLYFFSLILLFLKLKFQSYVIVIIGLILGFFYQVLQFYNFL